VSAECVINISEGRDTRVIGDIANLGGELLLDVHSDEVHHRSVLTVGGPLDEVENCARAIVARAVGSIDLTRHEGIHPRFGAADVVPFVPLDLGPDRPTADSFDVVVEARNRFARWAGEELSLPCFFYGPERSLPAVRRGAFTSLVPDTGPGGPHPTAGACAVGARRVMLAYNLWISVPEEATLGAAKLADGIAAAVRGPAVRSLGFDRDSGAQISCNLIDPRSIGPAEIYDDVARRVEAAGGHIEQAELVGLLPEFVLASTPSHRWAELDINEERTIESRLAVRRTRSKRPDLR
jgi:glutamate formiminotransferase / 5-formyltetrahydrofolate cyclo-ligase